MTAIAAPARLLRRPSRRVLTAAALLAVAAAAAVLWAGRSDDPTVRTVATPSGAFELSYPAGWEATAPEALPAAAGGPPAMISRPDGRGAVTVHEQPALDGTLAAVERDLDRRLARQLPDAEPVASRIVQLATGPALSYTFVRKRKGLVHGIVVAPAGRRTLLIDTVTRGNAADVARQIGAIVRSLTPGS